MRTSLMIARIRRGHAYLFGLVALAALLACGESPTSPSSSSPAGGSPASPPDPERRPALTGVVFETTKQGRRPVSGARVFVVDLVDGPYGDYGWFELSTDTNGRFSLANVFPGRTVKLTAYAGSLGGLWNQSGLFQVCAVHP